MFFSISPHADVAIFLKRFWCDGLISDCLDETRTARGSVLGIDSNFVMNPLKHFVAQHRADTDFADEPHLDRGSTNRDA